MPKPRSSPTTEFVSQRLSALAERWAAGLSGAASTVPLKRRRARVALVAVAAVLAAVGASAARGTSTRCSATEFEAPPAAAPVGAHRLRRPAQRRRRRVPKSTCEGASRTTLRVQRERISVRAHGLRPIRRRLSFRDASEARRDGRGRAGNRALPPSPERISVVARSGVSALPLGGLLLDRGEARLRWRSSTTTSGQLVRATASARSALWPRSFARGARQSFRRAPHLDEASRPVPRESVHGSRAPQAHGADVLDPACSPGSVSSPPSARS